MPFGLQRKKQKAVSVHVRLEPTEVALIERAAIERGLSFTAETRFLVKQALKMLVAGE